MDVFCFVYTKLMFMFYISDFEVLPWFTPMRLDSSKSHDKSRLVRSTETVQIAETQVAATLKKGSCTISV